MQERRDRCSFVRAIFQYDRGDPKEMPDVGNLGLLPELAAVNSGGVNQRFFKLRRESHVLFSFCRGKQIVWQSSQPEIYLGAIPRPRAAAAPGRRKWRRIESSAVADRDQHRAHGASAIDCSYWLGGVVRPRSMCCAISFRRLVIFRIVEVGNWRALISGRIQIFESEVRTRHNQ